MAQITIEVLNQLLRNAQTALKDWEQTGEPLHGAEDERWKDYHKRDCDAWSALYRAIDAIEKPIDLITQEGDWLTIGTNGLLTADRMLRYSPGIEDKYVLNGISLPTVEKFVWAS